MSFQEYIEKSKKHGEFVISLDGGGVRCILQVVILERLIEIFPNLLERCTLIAGTSAGSFVAMGLAHEGLPLCKSLFRSESIQRIFQRSWTDCFSNGWGSWRAKYDPAGLRGVLEDAFGETKLSDLNKRVLISSFDLQGQINRENPKHHNYNVQHWSPKFFDNFSPCEETVVEVGLSSSAAPCYFPSHNQFVDGGVVANNPSTHAIARLVKEGINLNNIYVLSLGSGNNPFHVEPENWGFVQWSTILLNLVMDGPSEAAVLQSQELLGDRYHRCNPILPEQTDLDDASQFETLKNIALNCDLLPTLDYLYKMWFPEIPAMLPAQVTVQLDQN